MFKNTYQNGLLSIFYSCGSNPLSLWDSNVHNGHIKRLTDKEINSLVLELVSTNVTTTYITCPRKNGILGIKLPFLVVVLKNMKRYFSFEIVILDDKNLRRRFKVSNFQSTTKVKPFCTSMPVGLSDGWNQIQFNLADFTQRAYGTQYIEALQVEVHANTRLRRIYFSDRLYTEEELPQEYKLFLPLSEKGKRVKDTKKDVKEMPPPSEATPKDVPPAEPVKIEEIVILPPVSSPVAPEEADKVEDAATEAVDAGEQQIEAAVEEPAEAAGEPAVQAADELEIQATDELEIQATDEPAVEGTGELAVEAADELNMEPENEPAVELPVEVPAAE